MEIDILKNNKVIVTYIFSAYTYGLIFLTLKNERKGKKSCFRIQY